LIWAVLKKTGCQKLPVTGKFPEVPEIFLSSIYIKKVNVKKIKKILNKIFLSKIYNIFFMNSPLTV